MPPASGTQTAPSRVRLARRHSDLVAEAAFAIAARVGALRSAGRDIADLSIGEPDLPTPDVVLDAGARALRDGGIRYTAPAGLASLRQAIASDFSRWCAPTPPEDVFVTPGAKCALLYAILATVNAGDHMLVPDPGFPPCRSQVALAGARCIGYPLGASADDIATRVTPRTRAILINSPGNPSGAALSRSDLEFVAELAVRHDLTIISDEIYARIWYGDGGRAPSLAGLPGLRGRTIVVDGFSKAWRMTGWRLGYAIVPPHCREVFHRLAVSAHSCVPGFIQCAGIAALEAGDEVVRSYVGELRRRRDELVNGLNSIPGVHCIVPPGAFYAFPDCSALLARLGCDDVALADHLLEQAGVAAVPGSAFGARGAEHLRLSFAASPSALRDGVSRIRHFLNPQR